MGRVLRFTVALLCGLIASAAIASLDLSLISGAIGDSTVVNGKTTTAGWVVAAVFILWALLGWLYWRSGSVRRIFGWTSLTTALAVLAFPVATAIWSASYVGRQGNVTQAQQAGGAIAGGVVTMASAVLSFFVAAVLLVVALLLLRGGPRKRSHAARIAPPATRKCPQCAEEVMADARICRFCRYSFDGPVTSDRP